MIQILYCRFQFHFWIIIPKFFERRWHEACCLLFKPATTRGLSHGPINILSHFRHQRCNLSFHLFYWQWYFFLSWDNGSPCTLSHMQSWTATFLRHIKAEVTDPGAIFFADDKCRNLLSLHLAICCTIWIVTIIWEITC